MNKIKHTLTKAEAGRLGVPVQDVLVVLRRDDEKPPEHKLKRITKHIFSLDGRRLGKMMIL